MFSKIFINLVVINSKKMKKVLFIFIIASNICFSQKTKIDSLENILNKTTVDSIKMKILAQLENLTLKTDFNKSQKYNENLFKLAKKKNDKYLAYAYEHKGALETQKANFEQSELYFLKALDIYKKLEDYRNIGDIYYNIARLSYMNGKQDKALQYFDKGIQIDSIHTNEKGLLKLYLGKGIIYLSKNELTQAIKYFILSLSISERLNYTTYIAYTNKKIGDAYVLQDNNIQARKYFEKAKVIFYKEGDIEGLAGLYNSLGIIEEKNKNYSKALDFSLKSLKYFKKINHKNQIINQNLNIGLLFEKLKNRKKAYNYYTEALKTAEAIKSKKYISKSLLSVAKIEIDQGKFKLAKTHINKALTNSNLANEFNKIDNFEFIAIAYANKLNYKEAYRFLYKLDSLKSISFKKLKEEQFTKIETKYQTQKKEKENLQLTIDKATQQLKLEKETKVKQYYAFGLITSLLILGIFGFYYKKNAKQKSIIETLQKELHHRVKNNLAIIDSLIEDIKDEFSNKNFTLKLTDLQNRIDSINEVHQQLYQNRDITHLNLKRYVDKLANNVINSFAKSNIQINNNIANSLVLDVEKSFSIGLIINEFFTNSFKYAFLNTEEGVVNVNISEINHNYILSLSDNGKGLPKDLDISKLNSFGIDIMQLLSKQLKGTFQIDGTNGVNLQIIFPKA